ncbi:MAG TPA: hypothetical protein VFH47_02200 [Candidatus Thermoplasmatota archaeon]|nr:hypothetical protein [Candidatus Thermoplasmatota archaeon]
MACGIAAGNGAAAASDSPGAISAFLGRWGPVGTLGLVVGALAYAIL